MTGAGHAWIAAHPYLAPIARFQAIVAEVAAEAPLAPLASPRWDAYAADRADGVPLLRSAAAGVDLAPAAGVLADVAERVSAARPPGRVAPACGELGGALREGARARRALAWVVAHDPAPLPDAPHPGLVRLLAWAVLRPLLASALAGERRREGAGWDRGFCPTCGALPALAQLLPRNGSRERRLACGCCGTRWEFQRIACPFCGAADARRLGILEVEGGGPVRIDWCGDCEAYVKTYTGEGDEELFLADWPTLHLDLAARRRGLVRAGASLYDLPEEQARSEP
ncbi:MAG TPA: formate dehydrogenase accessory protein FdhE [Anaeromyxobacter sp.]|nr:formate dehydrogenase accessory protein FdhE [Anaeromyxobacter sp.]